MCFRLLTWALSELMTEFLMIWAVISNSDFKSKWFKLWFQIQCLYLTPEKGTHIRCTEKKYVSLIHQTGDLKFTRRKQRWLSLWLKIFSLCEHQFYVTILSNTGRFGAIHCFYFWYHVTFLEQTFAQYYQQHYNPNNVHPNNFSTGL